MRNLRLIELDLTRVVLEGWEHFYNSLNVDLLRVAYKLGQRFPPVDIVLEKGIYRLAFGPGEDWLEINNYGGHSRAVLALQEKYPLSCRLIEDHRKNPVEQKDENYYPPRTIKYIPVSQMQPRRGIGWKALERLEANLKFLPNGARIQFAKEHNLVFLQNDRLEAQENIDNPPIF